METAYFRRATIIASSSGRDRKSTRLNSSHTVIYTLSLHDALPISFRLTGHTAEVRSVTFSEDGNRVLSAGNDNCVKQWERSEEHTSELQSHRDLHSFPTRRSSDLVPTNRPYSGSSFGNILRGWKPRTFGGQR